MAWTKQTARRSLCSKAPASLFRAAGRRATISKAGGKAAVTRHCLPGTDAPRDIRTIQRAEELFISRLFFQRLVHKYAQKYKTSPSYSASAVLALHEASEDYLVGLL